MVFLVTCIFSLFEAFNGAFEVDFFSGCSDLTCHYCIFNFAFK